ncbi:MAG: hypothetical protein HYU63_03220 [Armatimonadetes bacterium]|nr:hypothetical protein [Armatimonadota bacterium]
MKINNNQEEIKREILNLSKEGKITCFQALNLAKISKTNPQNLGKIINDLKIKIKNCQLGCFK